VSSLQDVFEDKRLMILCSYQLITGDGVAIVQYGTIVTYPE